MLVDADALSRSPNWPTVVAAKRGSADSEPWETISWYSQGIDYIVNGWNGKCANSSWM